MVYITLPMPGTEYGPCATACRHRDCEATRQQARQKCELCGLELGYEIPLASDTEGKLAHLDCVLNEQ